MKQTKLVSATCLSPQPVKLTQGVPFLRDFTDFSWKVKSRFRENHIRSAEKDIQKSWQFFFFLHEIWFLGFRDFSFLSLGRTPVWPGILRCFSPQAPWRPPTRWRCRRASAMWLSPLPVNLTQGGPISQGFRWFQLKSEVPFQGKSHSFSGKRHWKIWAKSLFFLGTKFDF